MLTTTNSALITERLSLRIVKGDQDIQELKRLNSVIFPINYNERFYKDIQRHNGDPLCFAVFVCLDNEEVIGTFSCRVEPAVPPLEPVESVYVMTFGLIMKYRMRGIGLWMWNEMIKVYNNRRLDMIVLHVQVGNRMAERFYTKLGFSRYGTVKDYYRRIDPPDAILLARPFKLNDTV